MLHLKTVLLALFYFFFPRVVEDVSSAPYGLHVLSLSASLCSRAGISSLFGRSVMRCYTLIRFHAIWGFRVSIMPLWESYSAVVFFSLFFPPFFFLTSVTCGYILNQMAFEPFAKLSSLYLFISSRINVSNMWQWQLYFPIFPSSWLPPSFPSSPSLWVC